MPWYNLLIMKQSMLPPKQAEQIGDKLYQKYGEPLEEDHWGEFIAISKSGKTVLSTDLKELFKKSLAKLGPGSFVFKVGEKAIWKWVTPHIL